MIIKTFYLKIRLSYVLISTFVAKYRFGPSIFLSQFSPYCWKFDVCNKSFPLVVQ